MPLPSLYDLRDCVNKVKIHKARDAFIASIDEEEVCNLASSYHKYGGHCQPFQPPARGSYNICFFVQFDDGEKWVVRIPLLPCLALGAKSKLESEVATMLVVSKRTSIPIPRVIAYRLGDGQSPLSSFLILEYVEGRKLSYIDIDSLTDTQLNNFYRSLASVYIQLRRLEFPSIGCLLCNEEGPVVSKMNASVDINVQELDGWDPSAIQTGYYGQSGVLASAGAYTSMLLQLADNAFAKNPSSVTEDEKTGADRLYHHNLFRQYAEKWVDPRFEHGPFVLAHGDLEPFNFLVDDDARIACVLDWEWSRVVPIQFFTPPLWFSTPNPCVVSYRIGYERFLEKFDKFSVVVRTVEKEMYGNEQLSDEWEKAKPDGGFLVAHALENWTVMDYFAARFIHWKWYNASHLEERIQKFMDEDPTRKTFIAKKLEEGAAYDAAIEMLKNAENDVGGGFSKTITTYAAKLADWQTVLGGGVLLILGASYVIGYRLLRH
ncbi:phosphotransferase enzyme family protein [Nemania sp. FL0031]|nr:phosphotransferase enzyme family protein [Nemania sp. FL0031]